MRVQLKRSAGRREDGVVSIVAAAASLALIGILAVVADLGYAYVSVRSLQNSADAAALAAGAVILEGSVKGETCSQMITDAGGQAVMVDAQEAARKAAVANGMNGSALDGDAVSVTCGDPVLPNRVVVSARTSVDSPSFFGGFLGYGKYPVTRTAKSVVGPAKNLVGLRPFALCDSLGNVASLDPDAYVTINFTNADQGCGSASGNFGTLDMRNTWSPPATDGPINGCPGNLVEDWIEDGYGGPVPSSSPLFIKGDPGIPSNNFDDEFNSILDEPIVIPTYDQVSGNGCNGVYRITGFVELKVCGFKLTNGNGAQTGGSCFDVSLAPTGNDRFVQLQFVRFIPVGQLDVTCQIAAACDSDVQVLKLAE